MEIKSFAGIGTRNLIVDGVDMEPLMRTRVSQLLSYLTEATLYSGGAPMMDSIFEELHVGPKKIFLPYKGFNKNNSSLYTVSTQAHLLARKYHPVFDSLSRSSQLFISRNGYQVLDETLGNPVDLVICGTVSLDKGGTSQAVRIARDYYIPVFNILYQDEFEACLEFLKNKTQWKMEK